MKSMKRGLAVFLAVLLMMPALPVSAGEIASTEVAENAGLQAGGENLSGTEGTQETVTGAAMPEIITGTPGAQEPGVTLEKSQEAAPAATLDVVPETTVGAAGPGTEVPAVTETVPAPGAENIGEVLPEEDELQALGTNDADADVEEVFFNTGSHTYRVTDSSVSGNLIGDACFGEDGNYTINIPEENPFFPYEVQFTYKGETTKEWFMTPDDSITVGGHKFFVSAYFDNTAVTQMSLNVAGDTIIVYPEEKEFTEDGGIMPASLLPLPEKRLTVDLSAYTPAELTMVSVSSIFTGANALADVDKVVWAYNDSEDDFKVSPSNGIVDLSYRTSYNTSTNWQMIVGAADQLAADNTRYIMTIKVTNSRGWLAPVVYNQDNAGNRTENTLMSSYYSDSYSDKTHRELYISCEDDVRTEGGQAYMSFTVNPSVFANTGYSSFRVYEGRFLSAAAAMSGLEITNQICAADMAQINAGYPIEMYENKDITIVTFDAGGNATGCLPLELDYYGGSYISIGSMFERTGNGRDYVVDTRSSSWTDECINYTVRLYQGYAADKIYYQTMSYYKGGVSSSSDVTAAYVGQYPSIAEANAAGAQDIKGSLFNTDYSTGGYGADYSQGVYFTVFIGADGTENQKVYRFSIKTEEGTTPKNTDPIPSSDTWVRFTGLRDGSGGYVPCYIAPLSDDSYGEENFVTILVKPDVDLTNLAPEFSKSYSINFYTTDENKPEISGVSRHDFSKGPVQYTASAEDKKASRNYWLKIMKANDGVGQLYINSLEDAESNTRTENGVIISTRQVMLDGYHDYVHDIWLANIGTADIPALSSELVSDVVELDEYWRLNGDYKLSGFSTIDKDYVNAPNGELPNLAKIRLKAKAGVENGTEVSGTLTIKSGGTPLMVLTLTGTVGDPCITTKEVLPAVKYVPYGTMIQNNNKYSWNTVSYEVVDGTLPGGMKVMQNGELYGVPTEAGEFTFTVRMSNSGDARHRFGSSSRTFTLTVVENTAPNVDGATDSGYDLTQRVQDIYLDASGNAVLPEESRTMVSQGIYVEFRHIFLDGKELVPGTDYNSESGSTRITIMNQTLLMSGASSAGTHTLGVEFRIPGDNTLKRAAQNYVIHYGSNTGGSGGSGSGGSGSSGGNSNAGGNGNNPNLWNTNANMLNGVNGAAAFAGAAVAGTVETVAYTIAAGDSLWSIAVKFYGSGSYWQKIFNDNAGVISDPDRIYAGQQIVIYLEREGGAAQGDTGNETGRTYVVEEGDTLWKISQKVYGRGWSWRRIYQANADIISEPGNIYVGQVIKIP